MNMEVKNKTRLRPLGYMESIQYILTAKLNIPRNVVVSFEFFPNISLNEIGFYIQKIQKSFLALRFIIREIDGIPWFFSDNSVRFPKIEENFYPEITKSNLIKEIEFELNEPLHVQKEMWRVRVISSNTKKYLLMTFNHCIFDGMSINKLLRVLWQHISDYKYNDINNNGLYPAIESILDRKYANSNTGKKIHPIDEFRWETFKPCRIKDQRSKIKIISVDSVSLLKIISFCKINKMSVSDLLCAVLVKSVLNVFDVNNTLLIHTPIDLTNGVIYHHTVEENIGCFIAVIKNKMKISKNENIVEIAKKYRVMLKSSDHLVGCDEFNYNDMLCNFKDIFDKVTTRFIGGLSISNIGRIQMLEDLKLKFVKDIFFTTSLLGGLGVLVLSALTVNGMLNIMLSYTHPLLDERLVEMLSQDIENNLKNCEMLK